MGGTLATITYNADGKRQLLSRPSTNIYYLWDMENVLLMSHNTLNAVSAKFTDFPGYWGGLVSQQTGYPGTYFVTDLSGNVREVVDASFNVTDKFVFRAFGERTIVATSQLVAPKIGRAHV